MASISLITCLTIYFPFNGRVQEVEIWERYAPDEAAIAKLGPENILFEKAVRAGLTKIVKYELKSRFPAHEHHLIDRQWHLVEVNRRHYPALNKTFATMEEFIDDSIRSIDTYFGRPGATIAGYLSEKANAAIHAAREFGK